MENIKQIKYAHKSFIKWAKQWHFTDIQDSIWSCNLYDSGKPIYKIEVSIHDDQSKPTHDFSVKNVDYWGWLPMDSNNFEMIFSSEITFSICFTYGYKAEEERGKGKSYRLKVKEIGKIEKSEIS